MHVCARTVRACAHRNAAAMSCRRKQLEERRQKNGRTPMKKFSYVKECGLDTTKFKHTPFRETQPNTPIPRKTAPALCSGKSSYTASSTKIVEQHHGNNNETFQPRGRNSFRPKVASGGVIGGGLWCCHGNKEDVQGGVEEKMLEEWQALRGRTLKRPCPVLPLQGTAREREAFSEEEEKAHSGRRGEQVEEGRRGVG